ncbi:hypothetical protein BKA70DRAFT_1228361 [Coprinopsis sp. MPI-PUGE-AT-0042]|nr:hypothetical protein BKA70DRAFT_1228361 [Coprinopsis sp. MPI-PUGE-AT-0042]
MTEFCSQQATSGTPAVDVFQRSLVFSGFPFLLVPHSNHRSSIPHFIACLRVERTMQCHHLRPPGPLPAMRIETSNLIIATSYLNAANTHALPLMATTNNDSPAIFKFADATEDLVWLRCKAVTKFLADVTMTSGQREAASKRPPLRPGLGGGRGPASVRISTDANDIKVKLYTHCLGLGSMVPISRLPSFSTEHMRSRVSVDDSGNVCAKVLFDSSNNDIAGSLVSIAFHGFKTDTGDFGSDARSTSTVDSWFPGTSALQNLGYPSSKLHAENADVRVLPLRTTRHDGAPESACNRGYKLQVELELHASALIKSKAMFTHRLPIRT